MSRYYKIQIFKPNSTDVQREITSYPKVGNSYQNDPGALNVIVDAYVLNAHAAKQYAYVQIWGLGIEELAQAKNFSGQNIKVYAGFQKGFPLNNATQSGLIVEGTIYQSFGNWVGTDMTLDLVITVKAALPSAKGLTFAWRAGTPLKDALAATLSTAFPDEKQNINISDKLILTHDQVGFYPDLRTLAQTLKPLTQSIIGGTYSGIDIALLPGQGFVVGDGPPIPANPAAGDSITVPANDPKLFLPTNQGGYTGSARQNADGTYTVSGTSAGFDAVGVSGAGTSPPAAPVIQIAFQDLIGQPVWIALGVISFTCPMRADLPAQTKIKMPEGILGNSANPTGTPGAVITTSASKPQAKQSSLFKGKFTILNAHHVGNFRDPGGLSWATVFQAAEFLG